MEWSEAIKEHVEALKPVKASRELCLRLFGLIDLTSLSANEKEANLNELFAKATSSYGHVASVCVHPTFVSLAATQFADTPVHVGTVANFPEGTSSLDDVLIEINAALEDGAQEIDVVFPYARYLSGERQYAHSFVEACKAACGDDVLLKVILETGALGDPAIIADASFDVLSAGADFIKTSTGKASEGATLEAAATMLLVIKHMSTQIHRPLGFKASGGIKTVGEAAQYLELADEIMGKAWVTKATFRLGSSKLVDEIIKIK